MCQKYQTSQPVMSPKALSSFQEALSPLICQGEGKILRKPLSTGAKSCLLILHGALDRARKKLLDVRCVGKSWSRGSVSASSRSSRRFMVLKWTSRNRKFLQCVERETRDLMVVRHELAEHTSQNVAFSRRGSAVAISSISPSVKLKAHPCTGEQADHTLKIVNSRN